MDIQINWKSNVNHFEEEKKDYEKRLELLSKTENIFLEPILDILTLFYSEIKLGKNEDNYTISTHDEIYDNVFYFHISPKGELNEIHKYSKVYEEYINLDTHTINIIYKIMQKIAEIKDKGNK